ncbi:MAG: hypothetical protein NTU51_09080 [Bacteroidetes bacterium]|nr:hypothetical protein [Bacteroidota bacterium]
MVESCCCSVEPAFPAITGNDASENLDSPDCCKTIRLYIKADFQSTRAQADLPRVISQPVQNLVFPDEMFAHPDIDCKIISSYTDTGPPLTGRERIISFQQAKIPCPSFCIS